MHISYRFISDSSDAVEGRPQLGRLSLFPDESRGVEEVYKGGVKEVYKRCRRGAEEVPNSTTWQVAHAPGELVLKRVYTLAL